MKHHTIILVPHARARFRKWRVTNRQLVTLGGLFLVFLFGSVFTTWSFFTNTVDRGELERIRTENDELRAINRSFETSIRSLQGQLDEFEERTRRLSIVAGLDHQGEGPEAGIGGDTPDYGAVDLSDLRERSGLLSTDLDAVAERLEERQSWIASTPSIAPVRGLLTSGFGYRRDPMSGRRAMHLGVDISTAPGRPVLAAADGVVIQAGRVGGLGNAVYISHGYGLVTRYGHLSKVQVDPGQRVRQGDPVGLVGSSGKSTGYHLHYEVRRDGKPENPIAYLLESPGGP